MNILKVLKLILFSLKSINLIKKATNDIENFKINLIQLEKKIKKSVITQRRFLQYQSQFSKAPTHICFKSKGNVNKYRKKISCLSHSFNTNLHLPLSDLFLSLYCYIFISFFLQVGACCFYSFLWRE